MATSHSICCSQSPSRWRCRNNCSCPKTWDIGLWTPSVSIWKSNRQPWAPRAIGQIYCRNAVTALPLKSFAQVISKFCRHSFMAWTSWSWQGWWEAPRWLNARPIYPSQKFLLGQHLPRLILYKSRNIEIIGIFLTYFCPIFHLKKLIDQIFTRSKDMAKKLQKFSF